MFQFHFVRFVGICMCTSRVFCVISSSLSRDALCSPHATRDALGDNKSHSVRALTAETGSQEPSLKVVEV